MLSWAEPVEARSASCWCKPRAKALLLDEECGKLPNVDATVKPTPRPNPVAEQENQPLQFKDFIPHLNELRRRLTVVLLALVVFVFTSFVLVEPIIHLLTRPIGGPDKLISIEVTENVSVFMRVSLLTGFILALPVLLYEIIAFLQLEPAEKRWLYW